MSSHYREWNLRTQAHSARESQKSIITKMQKILPRRREGREGRQKILPSLKQRIKDFLRALRAFAAKRF
jgi:hypothetical protein